MRQKLSMFLWEHNIHAGTDTKAEGFEDVIIAFFVEDANIAWAMQYFEGDYFAIGRWATDVLQHSGPTATEGPALSETTGASSPAQGPLPDIAPQGGSETMQSVTSSSLEFEVIVEPDADIFTERETGSQAGLTLEEAKSTDESLETSLRESFSSAQFSRALETLNRYGPEERASSSQSGGSGGCSPCQPFPSQTTGGKVTERETVCYTASPRSHCW